MGKRQVTVAAVQMQCTNHPQENLKKAEKMAIKSRNSNSGPRKKPMASLKRLMIYSTKSIKEHTILTCGKTRFNICDHSPSPT